MTCKVQLLENLRYFEHDDTDFLLTGLEIKDLPIQHLRSYSIKHYLYTGKMRVVEGDVTFQMKSSLVHISPEGLYGKEYGKYYTKDLEFDTITWITEDEVPAQVLAKLNGNSEQVKPLTKKTDTPEIKPVNPIKNPEVKKEEKPKESNSSEMKEEPVFGDLDKDGDFDKDDKDIAKKVIETELPKEDKVDPSIFKKKKSTKEV